MVEKLKSHGARNVFRLVADPIQGVLTRGTAKSPKGCHLTHCLQVRVLGFHLRLFLFELVELVVDGLERSKKFVMCR